MFDAGPGLVKSDDGLLPRDAFCHKILVWHQFYNGSLIEVIRNWRRKLSQRYKQGEPRIEPHRSQWHVTQFERVLQVWRPYLDPECCAPGEFLGPSYDEVLGLGLCCRSQAINTWNRNEGERLLSGDGIDGFAVDRLGFTADVMEADVTVGVIGDPELLICVFFGVRARLISSSTAPSHARSFAEPIEHDIKRAVDVVLKTPVQKPVDLISVLNQNFQHCGSIANLLDLAEFSRIYSQLL